MTLLALLPCGPETVHAVASGAVGRFRLRPRHDQRAMLARQEFFLLGGVASAAERGDFVRRGDAVGRDGSRRGAVLHAGSVAGVAAQSFLEVFVSCKIGDLLGVARRAKFLSFLGQEGKRKQQQGQAHK